MTIALKEMAGGIADQYNIPRPLFNEIIQTESSWNPYALGKAQEVGLGQLTPRMYKALGVNPWIPKENLTGSAKFLSQLKGQYGNWRDALSHYNGGVNLNNGRAYADKILESVGMKVPDSQSFTPILDAVKSGGDVVGAAVGAGAVGDKPVISGVSVMAGDGEMSGIKAFFAKYGLWALAALLILLGVWRVIK